MKRVCHLTFTAQREGEQIRAEEQQAVPINNDAVTKSEKPTFTQVRFRSKMRRFYYPEKR
jgi:hypothetical protein